MRIISGIVLSLFLVVLVGCQNPYSKFYTSNMPMATPQQIQSLVYRDCEPVVEQTNDVLETVKAQRQHGYVCIGYSAFVAKSAPLYLARWQGNKVRAERVFVQQRFSQMVSGVNHVVVPNPPQTIDTTYSGQTYGKNGVNGFYNGTAQTTVPGGYSTYDQPYSYALYEYVAAYMVQSNLPTTRPAQ